MISEGNLFRKTDVQEWTSTWSALGGSLAEKKRFSGRRKG